VTEQDGARISRAYVGSVAPSKLENWAIAKQSGLWGTTSGLGGRVRTGDEFYIWESKRGWRARCIVVSDAYEVTSSTAVPWVDGADYRWLFEIGVVTEVEPTMPKVIKGRMEVTDIPTIYVSRFSMLSENQANALRSLFPVGPPALQGSAAVGVVEPRTGWGHGQDRARNKLIEQCGVNEAVRHFGELGYKLFADRQRDGVGYDLEFSNDSEVLKVEVKGVASSAIAFNVTRKELKVSGVEPAYRFCVVTDALGDPVVTLLKGHELAGFEVEPVQYRVRSRDPRG
jgi:Domain of unknown function (DUF3883)